MVGLTAVPGRGIHSGSPCLGLKDGTNHHLLVVGVQPHLTGLVQVELVDVWVLSAVHCLNGVGTREESGVVAAQGCRQRCAVDATRTVGGDGTIEHSKVHGTGLVVDVLRSNLNKGVFRDLEATAVDDDDDDDDDDDRNTLMIMMIVIIISGRNNSSIYRLNYQSKESVDLCYLMDCLLS